MPVDQARQQTVDVQGLSNSKPANFRQGDVLRIPPGRYYVSSSFNAPPHGYIDLVQFTRGRVIKPRSSGMACPGQEHAEYVEEAESMCFRVRLHKMLHDNLDIILVPCDLGRPWRECECCPAHASLCCRECHQAWYCSAECQEYHWYKKHAARCCIPEECKAPTKQAGIKLRHMPGAKPKPKGTPRSAPVNNGVWGYGRTKASAARKVSSHDAGHVLSEGKEAAPPKLGLMKRMCCYLSQPDFAEEGVDFTLAVSAI